MIIDSALDDFASQMIKKFAGINFTPIMPALENVIRTSIDRNFSEGGRFGNDNEFGGGNQKWIESGRAKKEGGQTLVKDAFLVKSINIHISQSNGGLKIEIGSNLPYAAIQNFGGTINKPASSKLYTQERYKRGDKKGQYKKGTKFGQGATVGEHTITLPARPFLVLQNEDIVKMKQIISNYIFRTVFN